MTTKTTKSKSGSATKPKPKILETQVKEEEQISKSLQDDNAQLRTELDEMKSQLNVLASFLRSSQSPMLHNIEEKEVVFGSLFQGKLNLYTEPNCKGEHYSFEEYGEEHPIPWGQAKGIIKNQMAFVKDGGYFYVKDEEFVNSDPILKKIYKKMANKEKLEELFTLKRKDFITEFKALSHGQKELFADLILSKSQAQEEIDLNIVQIVGDALHKDLLQELSFAKTLLKTE